MAPPRRCGHVRAAITQEKKPGRSRAFSICELRSSTALASGHRTASDKRKPGRTGLQSATFSGERETSRLATWRTGRRGTTGPLHPGGLERQARTDEVLGIAVGELDVATHAPVLVELHLRADATVEVAVEGIAVFIAGGDVALEVRSQRAAHADFGAEAIEVVAFHVVALVGDAGKQVGVTRDRVVVAQADAPLVDVDAVEAHAADGFVVRLLAGEAAEDMEVVGDGAGAVDAPAVGIAAVGIGGDVATLDVVVGQALGRGSGERQGGKQGQGKQFLVHEGLSLLVLLWVRS